MPVSPSALSVFATLFVTIAPVETAAMFASLTAGVHKPERRSLAIRSVVIAGGMLLLFTLAGGPALSLLNVSFPAFRVAGGIMLFLQAMTLTFSGPGVSSISAGERLDAERPGDIAVFPLAFPVIAGPGALSAAVLVMGRANSWEEAALVVAALIVCLTITYAAMRASELIVHRLGRTGLDVVGRMSGLVLAALAVQFVFDGVRQANLLARP